MCSIRVAEFFSGIGGFHFAVRVGLPSAEVVAAFDIDTDSNEVYELNTGLAPTQVDIGMLSVEDLDEIGASVWLLSPPCQPFTRQGLRRDRIDPRSTGFLRLLDKMPKMKIPPKFICVENVVGFETSETRNAMIEAFRLTSLVYFEEITLSPDSLGVPYSRPRYFCLARTTPFQPPQPTPTTERILLRDFLEETKDAAFDVPIKVLRQCCPVINVVSDTSTLLNCFTKSYGGRYFKGTGSLLARNHKEWIPIVCDLQSICCDSFTSTDHLARLALHASAFPELGIEITADRDKCKESLTRLLSQMDIRYFTPSEISSIHAFPEIFSFPSSIPLRRRYALLGNSMSVTVVSRLITRLTE